MMRPTFVVRLNAFCMAMALNVAAIQAAERSPLLGLTQDQLIAQYGEPKSQIVAGNRVIFFFAHERVVLRDRVVVEVDRLPDTAAKPAPTPPAEAPSAAPTTERTAPTTGSTAPAPAPASASTAAPTTRMGTATAPAETPTEPAEPKFEIKSVRSGGAPRSQPKQETPAPPKVEQPAPAAAAPMRAPQPTAPVNVPPAVTVTSPAPSASATAPKAGATTPGIVATVTPPPDAEEPKPETAEPEKTEKEKKAQLAKKPASSHSASEPDIPGTAEIISSKRNYFITFLVIASGVGYLVWRYRQRRLALAVTAVSHTPFNAPLAAEAGGVVFNNELLQKLEWKRFEELVASYYSKTGVVAQRTKSGPNAPVHIKISWKGEPRPFAYVQCIAHPVGLIDAKPLQELVNVLAAEDIRRGYVVSMGKFNVNARDLAEEKHLTLLPGDIFLEKLNALPDAARAELMQQTTAGDYTTPSCPKCDAKMVKAIDDPTTWRCPNHPDQRIPVQ